jgi:hypothetical protein
MAVTPEGTLFECLEAAEVALVVGAGVSAATCPDSTVDGHYVATWKGLLEHGIEFAVAWTQAGADWATRTSEHVRSDDLETAAHLVVARLTARDRSDSLMAKWLKCTVGTL